MRAPLARSFRVAESTLGDRARGGSTRGFVSPPIAAASVAEDSYLGQPRAVSAREANLRPHPGAPALVWGGGVGQRCVTPRQTCPRPNGLGRNLRSKTRWFTGFCNSHQVSHFATFFIDARAEISVAESRFRLYIAALLPNKHRLRVGESRLFSCIFLDTFRAGVW